MIPTKEQIAAEYARASGLGLITDLRGWHYEEPIFERLVQEIRPQVYIEVGSYKGASMARVVHLMLEHSSPYPLNCFAVDFWQEPGLYDQFLYNMKMTGCADHVWPIRAHSAQGAKLLKNAGIVADLIYIDAGHSYEDCLRDMQDYWPLLRKGGVMFGDDYTEEVGVREAVIEFGKPFSNTYYHWQLRPKE